MAFTSLLQSSTTATITNEKNLKRISAKFGNKGRIATKNSNKIDIHESYGSN
jgi:hypothetical protein